MRIASAGLLLTGLLVASTGCKSYGKMTSVAFSAATLAKASATLPAALDGGNGLTIDRIRVVVRRVEVEAPEGGCTVSATGMEESGGGDVGDCEFSGGPFLVDLSGAALDGGIHWVATIEVPAGTFDEVKFDINTIPAELAGTDAGLKAMADAHASIIVDGTLMEAPFTFSTPIEVAQKREGPIAIGGSSATNLTLDVDPSGWFKAADGTLLSPGDPTALGAILANIRASIRIVHDDDRDGLDDENDGS